MATISVAVRCAPAVPEVVTSPASRRAWWPAIASRVTLFCWPSATTYSWAPRPNASLAFWLTWRRHERTDYSALDPEVRASFVHGDPSVQEASEHHVAGG